MAWTEAASHFEQSVKVHIRKFSISMLAQRASRVRVCQKIPGSTKAHVQTQERLEFVRQWHGSEETICSPSDSAPMPCTTSPFFLKVFTADILRVSTVGKCSSVFFGLVFSSGLKAATRSHWRAHQSLGHEHLNVITWKLRKVAAQYTTFGEIFVRPRHRLS